MKRTGFLLAAVLVVTVAFALSAAAKTTRRVVDVLIIGGTTSGTTAAVAAARQGVTTLVVESTPMLGGMFTAQGVPAVDGNANLPSGLWNEFREALRAHYGGAPALATGWVSNTLFEPHVADSIFKAMAAAEPALSVEYGFRPVKVFRRGRKVSGARFVDKAGNRLEVSAEVTGRRHRPGRRASPERYALPVGNGFAQPDGRVAGPGEGPQYRTGPDGHCDSQGLRPRDRQDDPAPRGLRSRGVLRL